MLQHYLFKWLCFPLAILFLVSYDLPAQQNKIDSLEQLLTSLPEDTNRVKVLNTLSRYYFNNDPEKLKLYADTALTIALKLNDAYSIGSSYTALGNYYFVKNINAKTLFYYQKALEFFQKSGNKKSIAAGYSNLSRAYANLSDYPKAIELALIAKRKAEAIRDSGLIASVSLFIGNQLKIQEKGKEALQYYNVAYQYFKRVKDRDREALTLNSIGGFFLQQKQYKEAIEYISKALQIADSMNLYRHQCYFNNSLGFGYTMLKGYTKALYHYGQALEKSERYGYPQSKATALYEMGDVYLQKDQPAIAAGFLERALQQAKESGLTYETMATHKDLAEAYEKQGNYKLAYEHHTSWVDLKDSLFNKENTRKIDQLQANYQIEKKQAQIELLQKDQQNARLLRNGIAAGFVALLLIAGLVVSRQRLKIRQNRLLLEKSQEVAHKNEQLAQQAQKLKELDEAKSRFFANISHEFRTPLTLILNNLLDKIAVLKKQDHPPADELAQLQVMHRNAMRLLQLINQLLDLSKLESGKMKLNLADNDLTSLLQVIHSSFDSLAHIRGIRFISELPQTPLLCRFDADKLEKMLYNLLSNAFKFTPNQGQITFSTRLLHEEEKTTLLQIRVQDSGPGMDKEQASQVFNRFYQGKQYYSDEQGTGIGLALTKELVELHGGNIWVESEPGKGSVFTIQLPFIEAQGEHVMIEEGRAPQTLIWQGESVEKPVASLNSQIPTVAEGASVSNVEELPVVLMVEDNEDMRSYIRKHLHNHYRIIESEDGFKGVDKAFETIPDLIISDYMMPGMDGLQLCTKLKTDQRTSHIPIIMLTALATDDAKLKGLETGADDYLTKPFDSRELQLRIRNLIDSRRKLRERFSREIHLEPASITVTSTDEKFLQKVIKTVEENMGDWEFSMEDFGSEVGLSRMQLHRKLKALTGQTPGDFLRQMRLKRAAQLLQMQAGNISEIAYQVGFNNLSYFAKCFREQFGMAPNEYAAIKAIQIA